MMTLKKILSQDLDKICMADIKIIVVWCKVPQDIKKFTLIGWVYCHTDKNIEVIKNPTVLFLVKFYFSP